MTDLVGRTLYRLAARLPGQVSTPGDDGYAAATAIWSKPVGARAARRRPLPDSGRRALAVRAALLRSLASVRGGGHDWAVAAVRRRRHRRGRHEKCTGGADERAPVSGGARAADVAAATDRWSRPATGLVPPSEWPTLRLAAAMPADRPFRLALDNLEAAEVALADGRTVVAKRDSEGSCSGVARRRRQLRRRHDDAPPATSPPSVRSARPLSVHRGQGGSKAAQRSPGPRGGADVAGRAAGGPTELPWSWSFRHGAVRRRKARRGSRRSSNGTALMSTVETMSYGDSLTVFDSFSSMANGICRDPLLPRSTAKRRRFHRSDGDRRLARPAPSSPTSSKAPLRVCRREVTASVCVGTMC